MKMIHHAAGLRAAVREARRHDQKVAFIPTMGCLHEGHLTLVDQARQVADCVIVSIFVNPLQFGPGEDFERYPRTLEADAQLLAQRHCDVLFAPDVTTMYPDGQSQATRVTVSGLDQVLCGAHRPGHFDGVATVVTKLFQLVQPDIALLGEKDYQQLQIIRQCTSDLCMPVDIMPVATARDTDGLALSSRNRYLSPSERHQAPQLFRTLQFVRDALLRAPDQLETCLAQAHEQLCATGFDVDYLTVLDDRLQPPTRAYPKWRVFVAARLGSTRLIDNLAIDLSGFVASDD